MKIKLLQIIATFLVLSVTADSFQGYWSRIDDAIEIVENTEQESSKDNKKEKEESNDKISYLYFKTGSTGFDHLVNLPGDCSFRTSAYLSLPEIPPELI